MRTALALFAVVAFFHLSGVQQAKGYTYAPGLRNRAMWKNMQVVMILAAVPLTAFGVIAVLAGNPWIMLAGLLYVVAIPLLLFGAVAFIFLLGNSIELIGALTRRERAPHPKRTHSEAQSASLEHTR
jgi:hypothetical protein